MPARRERGENTGAVRPPSQRSFGESRIKPSSARWLTWLILGAGLCLRVAQGLATPYLNYYDNHFEPLRIIAEQHRIPAANECWSCYQPPLFYSSGAAVYAGARQIALWSGVPAYTLEGIGEKSVQMLNVLAGCATLIMTLLILRTIGNFPPLIEALGLGIAAFFPAHLRMSAMVTNDVLTHFWMTAAILALLRTARRGWPTLGCILTGVLCGAAILTKIYGAVTLTTALIAVICFQRCGVSVGNFPDADTPQPAPPQPSQPFFKRLRAAGLICIAALSIGIWPTIRDVVTYHRWHVDNYDLFPNRMLNQPPGSISAVEFLTVHPLGLWHHPWLHAATLTSLPTQLFARSWWDYAGFRNTLGMYQPFAEHRRLVGLSHENRDDAAYFAEMMNYDEALTPDGLRRLARMMYCIGLFASLWIAIGVFVALGRARQSFGVALLLLHFAACLSIPLVQTLRVPIYSAMKIEFSLGFLSSIAIFATVALVAAPSRCRKLTFGIAAVVVLGLLSANVALIASIYSESLAITI